MNCGNCGHPVVWNPVTEIWEHGEMISLSETFCCEENCECLTPCSSLSKVI